MVASGVATESLWGISHAASSSTGVLAYVPGSDLSLGRLAWIDRKGFVQYLPKVPPQIYGIVDLAPDDSLIAVQVSDVSDYILLWDPRRMEGRRVPYDGPEGRPLWSYTGQRLAGTGFGGIAILHDIAPGGAATPGVVLKNAKSPSLVTARRCAGDVWPIQQNGVPRPQRADQRRSGQRVLRQLLA